MSRLRAFMAAAMMSSLAGCGGLASGTLPSQPSHEDTVLRPIPIVSPTPAAKHADTVLRPIPIVSPTPAPKHADTVLRPIPIVSPTPTAKP